MSNSLKNSSKNLTQNQLKKEYNINSDNYLGSGKDCAGHHFCAFLFSNEYHIVYNIGTPDEYITFESQETIYRNLENYLWTPYAQFI